MASPARPQLTAPPGSFALRNAPGRTGLAFGIEQMILMTPALDKTGLIRQAHHEPALARKAAIKAMDHPSPPALQAQQQEFELFVARKAGLPSLRTPPARRRQYWAALRGVEPQQQH